MPDHPDDDLVPPLKVMRKRLNGVYRADSGFSGPTRRYVLIVALLVGLASVPTLAAITAGSHELADGRTDTMDIPFLPPASPGPIGTQGPGSPTFAPPTSPSTSAGPSPGATQADRSGRSTGTAGVRQDRSPQPDTRSPATTTPDRDEDAPGGGRSAGRQSPRGQSSGSHGSGQSSGSHGSGQSSGGQSSSGGQPSGPQWPAVPGDPEPTFRRWPGHDSGSHRPGRPGEPPVWGHRPTCHERGRCGDRPSHHHRPDPSYRHRQCDGSTHRAQWSHRHHDHHHRGGDTVPVNVQIDATAGHGEHLGSTVSHRSLDRSEHSRRSAVTERPQNIRAASILERSYSSAGHNSRRLIHQTRGEDFPMANRSYRGSHRAPGQHHADDGGSAERRGSRVGRHHADQHEDYINRR